jgi:hypothetical protein
LQPKGKEEGRNEKRKKRRRKRRGREREEKEQRWQWRELNSSCHCWERKLFFKPPSSSTSREFEFYHDTYVGITKVEICVT